MKILIVIPARGGSKGIKNKNIMPLLGKPLIEYTIDAAKEAKLADKIVVSTEDDAIATFVKTKGVQVINRPKEFATDEAPIEWALRHAVGFLRESEGYYADIVVWLQANVPIRKEKQIDYVVQKLIDTHADSVITVTEVTQRPEFMKRMVDENKIEHLTVSKEYRRQDCQEKLYLGDGAVIAICTDILMNTEGMTGAHVYLGDDIRGVIEEPQYAIEIDEPFDYDVAKGLLLINKNMKK